MYPLDWSTLCRLPACITLPDEVGGRLTRQAGERHGDRLTGNLAVQELEINNMAMLPPLGFLLSLRALV